MRRFGGEAIRSHHNLPVDWWSTGTLTKSLKKHAKHNPEMTQKMPIDSSDTKQTFSYLD